MVDEPSSGGERSSSGGNGPAAANLSAAGPIERACKLPPEYLTRIERGFHPDHSEDVTFVPKEPNYWGSFTVVSHTGPWEYLQRIPLVLYGPGYIVPQGERLDAEAGIIDVYPTVERLLGSTFKGRTGAVLEDALEPAPPEPPKVILTIMWDGVGRNMLDRWPNRWPTLARLEREGTSYGRATIGSSPSVTPATHASLATGAFPKDHEVIGINMRNDAGKHRLVFSGGNPDDMKLTTYGDQWDKQAGNAAKVGLLAWRQWHMPMLGHGLRTKGGDKDILGLIDEEGFVGGYSRWYSTPGYLTSHHDLFERHVDEVDKEDGKADGLWLGNEIEGGREDNPAFVRYSGDLAMKMLRQGGFGADDVPDLFFANFKQTDIAGHSYTIDSQEVADNLEEQDAQLARILDYLEREVGRYVVILTADHGHTRRATVTGAWPFEPVEVKADIQRRFGVPAEEELFQSTTPAGPFMNHRLMKKYGFTSRDVARYLNDYTIRENWPDGERLPQGYRNRGDERILAGVWAARDLPKVLACAGLGPEGP
jgi:predicted AlkP superfamily pyrophosphatase or phosphodiesterase